MYILCRSHRFTTLFEKGYKFRNLRFYSVRGNLYVLQSVLKFLTKSALNIRFSLSGTYELAFITIKSPSEM